MKFTIQTEGDTWDFTHKTDWNSGAVSAYGDVKIERVHYINGEMIVDVNRPPKCIEVSDSHLLLSDTRSKGLFFKLLYLETAIAARPAAESEVATPS